MVTLKVIPYLFCFTFSINIICGYIVEPGPTVIATKGEVWPKPQVQTTSDLFYILKPQEFKFRIVSENCSILQNAIQRYKKIINDDLLLRSTINGRNASVSCQTEKKCVGHLTFLDIFLKEPCDNIDFPTASMEEKYTLNISSVNAQSSLSATTIWGILRGLETFSQLLFPIDSYWIQINCTEIHDYPRFSHRGLLIDTSRHFIPVPKIEITLDAMAYNKLNVFHWHITDDQSFPYQSIKYPKLSEKGAYSKMHVYSKSQVKEIIQYASERGIRVLVEFDTPGHTRSWGEAIPDLLTPCYKNDVPSGQYGPIDPTKNYTYTFLKDFFAEIVQVFPDQYLHLGGDEVEFECWSSNPEINKFMSRNNITSYRKLEEYYIQKLLYIVDDLKAKSIVWEEVFSNGVTLPNGTVVHVWKGYWQSTMRQVTSSGLPALLSSCWYLDHLATGGDWVKYYNCEPYSFSEDEQLRKLVLGGEACMWSEVVNEYNIESRVWPRASATAEKLWSSKNADTSDNANKRLEEHTCRMNKRGINAQPPNGAGFCEF